MTKDAYINKLAEDDIKRIEWATHSTTIDPLELLDMLAGAAVDPETNQRTGVMNMSVVAVLDIIGKSIEELQKENQRLKSELSTLYESREFMLSRLRDVEKERDELKSKLNAVQDYADSLAQEIEDANNKESRMLHALNFDRPDEVIIAEECENVSKPE